MEIVNVIFVLVTIVGCCIGANNVRVTSLLVPKGSLNGGTRITIEGSGFADDQFNFGVGKERLGNEVKLVSNTRSYICDMHKDGCTETQLMCYTRPVVEDSYSLRLKVNGVNVPVDDICSRCKFKPSAEYTPTIDALTPQLTPPGALLSLNGKLFTDKYGSHIKSSSNGRRVEVLRVFAGGQKCELFSSDSPDTLYGLKLKSESSDHGNLKCKAEGTYIGPQNISFIVSNDYGRSFPSKSLIHVMPGNRLGMLLSHAEIIDVNVHSGSKAGGTKLIITGKNFDNTNAPPRVLIDGLECPSQYISQTELHCVTPARLHDYSWTIFPGSIGGKEEFWNGTHHNNDMENIRSLTSSDDGYSSNFATKLNYVSDDMQDGNDFRMKGFFVPPFGGVYTFYVKADDGMILYFSNTTDPTKAVPIASNPTYVNGYTDIPEQKALPVTLKAGESYYYEAVSVNTAGQAGMSVAVHYAGTLFTRKQTHDAIHEKQKIEFTSQQKNEKQVIQLSNWKTQKAHKEVQRIEIRGTGDGYSLGFGGVWTGILQPEAGANTVQNELNALPTIKPDSVTVTSRSGGNVLEVVFNTNRGNVEILSAVVIGNAGSLSINITEEIAGISSLETFQLTVGGATTKPIFFKASSSEISDALEELFIPLCPLYLTQVRNKDIKNDYETSYQVPSGHIVNDDSFCGKKSVKNPSRIIRRKSNPINPSRHRYLCFAYKGHLHSKILIKYVHSSSGSAKEEKKKFNVPSFKYDGSWQYTCVDLYTLMKTQAAQHTYGLGIIDVEISRNGDIWFDTLSLTSAIPLQMEIDRMPARRRLSPPQKVQYVSVKSANNIIEINIKPRRCSHGFDMLTPYNSQHEGGGIYRQIGWPSNATISISRLQSATTGVSGQVDLKFKGQTLQGVPVEIEENVLKGQLESLGIVAATVSRTGSCAGYSYEITMNNLAGDQPELEIDTWNVTGPSVNTTVTTVADGGVFFDPIPGWMLRSAEKLPQILAFINSVPSRCTGKCDFQWKDNITPKIHTISPLSGTEGAILTISGELFSTNVSLVTVSIGGHPCMIISSNLTNIQCRVGPGGAGLHLIVVNVENYGFAVNATVFQYNHAIVSFQPTSGPLSGGTIMNITGKGFTPDISVVFGDVGQCEIQEFSFNHVTCMIPTASIASSVTVTALIDGKNEIAVSNFTYLAPSSFIQSINTSAANVDGSTVIHIHGLGFNANGSQVNLLKVGNGFATILSYSKTDIIAVLPPNKPGSYPLKLRLETGDYSDLKKNSIPNVMYTLRVDGLEPSTGSMFGGTNVIIRGQGFSSLALSNEVKFGDTLCQIKQASEREIRCQIEQRGRTHQVNNMGDHPEYGVGFMWSPSIVEVQVGDTVRWDWEPPEEDLVSKMMVCQTLTAVDTSCMTDGFRSGQAPKGGFQNTFREVGNFPYWSGWVNAKKTIGFYGQVNVIQRKSTSEYLKLTVGKIEAAYNISTGFTNVSKVNVCPRLKSTKSGCVVTNKANQSTLSHGRSAFAFQECSTPSIASINHQMEAQSSQYAITMTGSGLAERECQAVVKINGDVCLIRNASETSLTCLFTPTDDLDIGQPLTWSDKMSVHILGRGYAVIGRNSTTLVPKPVVTAVEPTIGSTEGGTEIRIQGMHLSDTTSSTSVAVIGIACSKLEQLSANILICVTPSSAPRSGLVVVSVTTEHSQTYPGTCVTKCAFKYNESATPKVYGEHHSLTGKNAHLVITGDRFGSDTNQVKVSFAKISCNVTFVNNSHILCSTDDVEVGDHRLVVNVGGLGLAISSALVKIKADLPTLNPSSGSINGQNELKVNGFGFDPTNTSVSVGGKICKIHEKSSTLIKCKVPPSPEASADVVVTSNLQKYPSVSYAYRKADTPTVSLVSPSSGGGGTNVTITGSGFGNDRSAVSVSFGDTTCDVFGVLDTSINCAAQPSLAGDYSVNVLVVGKGLGTSSSSFTYELTADNVDPNQGGFAGGQVINIHGSGFSVGATNVIICNEPCEVTELSSHRLKCLTPQVSGSVSSNCPVKVSSGSSVVTLSSLFTYLDALTPLEMGVEPKQGGTGGGTLLNITGSGFGTNTSDVDVSIAGSRCMVKSVSDNIITCTTAAHKPSVKATVNVVVHSKGRAKIQQKPDMEFHYIDVWSSVYTWGGKELPTDGDMVVIEMNQTLLIDVPFTPIIKMILIKGGKLVFDERDIVLNVENILVLDGGVLEIGTESNPFSHKATIILHGNMRSPELPIYGTKTIAIREGAIELHGKRIQFTWTRLSSTAAAGSLSISVQDPIKWQTGDRIIIATTGLRHSQQETEVREIASVVGKTITLTQALDYEHLGISVTYGGQEINMRAEVGLLTRNIVIKGTSDPQWHDKIPACEDGFDTGEFAVQTCFQGRFGEETGSDQFGGQIMLHASKKDQNLVQGHIEYVEVTYAGQAFRLGRYPVHFHLNGNMNGSYVRGCAIHHTFNRAVNIHGTHNVLVDGNVVHDVMGGALFLEDGIETGNIFQYNLISFVKSSTSLLNDDVTPASIWITNPDNIVRHNAAVGGTHFGYWYRMKKHPEGPSHTKTICPRKIPIKEFANNTAHSFGWFGLWIFEFYFPMEGGSCESTKPVPAVFESLTTWHSEKCAEWVNCGAIQFHNFKCLQNSASGIEMKLISQSNLFSVTGAMVKDSLIVGKVKEIPNKVCTKQGIVLPLSPGLLAEGNTFINFDDSSCVAAAISKITGTSSAHCGGFAYHFKRTSFENSPNKLSLEWANEGRIFDVDGSFTGATAGSTIVTKTPILPPKLCKFSAEFSKSFKASVCEPSVRLVRFAFNKPLPSNLLAKDVIFTNEFGSIKTPFVDKRITHKPGWMTELVVGHTYNFIFKDVDHVTNISYIGTFYGLKPTDWIVIHHNFTQNPDHFQVLPNVRRNGSLTDLTYANNINGDWNFKRFTKDFTYIVSGKSVNERKKRGLSVREDPDYIIREIHFKVFRCFYPSCIKPKDPGSISQLEERPDNFTYWSDEGSPCWNLIGSKPSEGDDFIIPADCWIVVDIPIPNLGKLEIHGTLEIDHELKSGKQRSFRLNCSHIFINNGRLVIGWESAEFENDVTIVLRGSHSSPDFLLSDGPNMGAKSIGVFGGLDLHGKKKSIVWTRLSKSASSGESSITLIEPVDWDIGDEIVITTTSHNPSDTEIRRVTSKNADNRIISLDRPIQFNHNIHKEEIPGTNRTIQLSCEVGRLSRNIKIVGADYPDLLSESFGARILVGKYSNNGFFYTGYARISNVEFYHTGQEGWIMPFDPRFSLVFLDIGDVTGARPSYVKGCAFHHGFSPAIGVFGSNRIPIENNVVYHTVGAGIIVRGQLNKVFRNLVTLSLWPGSYNGRNEPTNIVYHGGIEVNFAQQVFLKGNVVAGSERAAYRVDGESCNDGLNAAEPWLDNQAHSNMFGVVIFPTDVAPACMKISGFTIYKSFRYGIYSQNRAVTKVNGVTLVDNGLGVLIIVNGPSISASKASHKYVEISNSIIVGRSGGYICEDTMKGNLNVKYSGPASIWQTPSKGSVGFSWPIFISGTNNAPLKPWDGDMSYPSYDGLTKIKDVIFYKFESTCGGQQSVIMSTPPKIEDMLFPVETSNITQVNVDANNIIFLMSPNVGKVNPSDCVDMDCDAKKKCLVRDLDGSFIRSAAAGSIIPITESEWDGDPRHGVGDYRIPRATLVDAVGNIKPPPSKKGVYRESCKLQANWQGYKCEGAEVDYQLMAIASLDPDNEIRRLSPVALVGDDYVDLVNGPQDHGWCSGYTCQRRISTFHMLVLNGKHYEVYFASTNPQKTRFQLLNVDNDYVIRLGISYFTPHRLDIYVDGKYVHPLNRHFRSDGKEILKLPTKTGEFMPQNSGTSGDNYHDRTNQLIFVLIKGATHVDIRIAQTVIVSLTLPAMTIDEFFSSANVINNLALFLNIPADKIRVVNPVSASRRKRAVQDLNLVLEIGDKPSASRNDSIANSTTYQKLIMISDTIVDLTQSKILSTVLNATVKDIKVSEPLPQIASTTDSSQYKSTTEKVTTQFVQIPAKLVLAPSPLPEEENMAFVIQPHLRIQDAKSSFIAKVGSSSLVWIVQARLKFGVGSDQNATLIGNVNTSVSNGWANFTNLGISHNGSNYVVEFYVVHPASALKTQSSTLQVNPLLLKVEAVSPKKFVTVGTTFMLTVKVLNSDGSPVDLTWKGESSWNIKLSVCTKCFDMPTISGSLTAPLNLLTNTVTFNNLTVLSLGKFIFKMTVESYSGAYSSSADTDIFTAIPSEWIDPGKESSKQCRIMFPGDYATVVGTKTDQCSAAMWNKLQPVVVDVTVKEVVCSPGSVSVSFVLEGSNSAVKNATKEINSLVHAGLIVNINDYSLTATKNLIVDGVNYGVTPNTDAALSTGIIVAIALISCFVVIGIVALGLYLILYHNKKVAGKKMSVAPSPRSTTSLTSLQLFDQKKSLEYYDAPQQMIDKIQLRYLTQKTDINSSSFQHEQNSLPANRRSNLVYHDGNSPHPNIDPIFMKPLSLAITLPGSLYETKRTSVRDPKDYAPNVDSIYHSIGSPGYAKLPKPPTVFIPTSNEGNGISTIKVKPLGMKGSDWASNSIIGSRPGTPQFERVKLQLEINQAPSRSSSNTSFKSLGDNPSGSGSLTNIDF